MLWVSCCNNWSMQNKNKIVWNIDMIIKAADQANNFVQSLIATQKSLDLGSLGDSNAKYMQYKRHLGIQISET